MKKLLALLSLLLPTALFAQSGGFPYYPGFGAVGLGTTPGFLFTILNVINGSDNTAFIGLGNTSSGQQVSLYNNVYYNGSYRYAANNLASELSLQNGQLIYQQAVSGTTGNVATLSNTFRILAGGPALFNGNTASTNIANFLGSSGTGTSDGVQIEAGSTSADFALIVSSNTNSPQFMEIYGDGGITVNGGTDEGQGTLNVASAYYLNSVNLFTSGNFAPALTGFAVAPTGCNMNWHISGDVVTVVETTACANTSNATTMTATNLPAAITPSHAQILSMPGGVENATIEADGQAVMNTNNTITFYLSPNQTAFGAAGSKGLEVGATLVYSLKD